MEKPKFKNKPNTLLDCNGTPHYIHRAVSVDAFVFALAPKEIEFGQIHVLVIKRADTMEVDPGKYGVPCGYLDWNETIYEAVIREVYEETSLYLPNYKNNIEFDNNKQPFFIDSNPDAKYNSRQNVAHNFIFALDFSNENPDTFPSYVQNYTSNETSLVKWVPWYDFIRNDLEWSFNHEHRVSDAMKYLMSGFVNRTWYYKDIE